MPDHLAWELIQFLPELLNEPDIFREASVSEGDVFECGIDGDDVGFAEKLIEIKAFEGRATTHHCSGLPATASSFKPHL
jgi:hypothetical protein